MEKRLIWIGALLKIRLKKPVLWIQAAVMLILMWMVSSTVLPNQENTYVLIYNEDGFFGEQLIEHLEQGYGEFIFQEAGSPQELRGEILAGHAECGFILEKGLEEGLQREETKELILFICSDMSNKASSVLETFYQELFSMYSTILLEHRAPQLFHQEVLKDALTFMKERNEYYKKSEKVFDVTYEYVDSVQEKQQEEKDVFPIRGIAASMILLHMMLVGGEAVSSGRSAYEKNLRIWEKREFLFWKYVISSIILAAAAIIGFQILEVGGNLIIESVKMMVFLGITSLWVILLGTWLKKEAVYYGCICPILVVNLLFPPVFFSIAAYIPAVRWLNFLLPVGIYLKIQ
ncbi:MAG: hypothetical protein HFI76_06535 [Lachnospiraceae bacterium]|nr:hypothetical protein [Lachnospiraceae bacterium]